MGWGGGVEGLELRHLSKLHKYPDNGNPDYPNAVLIHTLPA